MLVRGQDWYLIGLGPKVSCGQVADLTKFSGFLVSLVCKPPHFSWILGIKLLELDWLSWFRVSLDTLID